MTLAFVSQGYLAMALLLSVLTGYANADCIEQLEKDELGGYLGALSPASMTKVNRALAIALAI